MRKNYVQFGITIQKGDQFRRGCTLVPLVVGSEEKYDYDLACQKVHECLQTLFNDIAKGECNE